ncbi:FAD:protein FMN transferase [Butyrivibrio sp. X503]|uniref:FAD:protein FMN transferase n=1 Tax=Butyrivibrio sp. X503 TaxID=2364878 RepID=UPI0013142F61|nr:FAD:protein FMN transferase [Butyrivibrio sp. X503]
MNINIKKKNNCIGAAFLVLEVSAVMLTGCTSTEIMNTSTIFAMDTVMELEIRGDESLLSDAEQKIREIENTLSVTKDSSDIGVLNTKKKAKFSSQAGQILSEAISTCEMTGGSLDISIYPVLKEWGFTTGEYRVPDDDELEALIKNVDYKKIDVKKISDGSYEVSISDDMQIDLGSVVKGYTGSYLADYFKENGVSSGLINLGGNVECIGNKPDGAPWRVAIKSPFSDSKSGVLGVLEASDTAVITSGGYERFFEKDGEIYWHILDPKTGKPAKNGIVSVTVVGNNGLMCDGLSTALFVKGTEGAIEFIKEHAAGSRNNEGFGAILITEDKKVYVTDNIAASFSLSAEYSDCEVSEINIK